MIRQLFFYIRHRWTSVINRVRQWFGKSPTSLPPKSDFSEKDSANVGTRYPEDYLKTFPSKASSSGSEKIPWIKGSPNTPRHPPLPAWTQLSRQILKELFSALGIEYVPEIVLHAMGTQDPLSAFTEFCARFDYPTGNRVSRHYLQDVVLFLFDMDMLRKKTPLNPDVIYQALEQHRWIQAEKLLESMKNVAELLEKLDSNDARLGIHREMLENAEALLSLSWYENLEYLDPLYEAHLKWEEKEAQYQTFQRFIADCIGKIERKEFRLGELAETYENIKALWMEIQEFLEEKAGDPEDEELGFPMLAEICKGLQAILDAYDEQVEEPADEETMTLADAWTLLTSSLKPEDADYFSEFKIDIWNMDFDIKKADLNFIKKVFRRAALRTHPDHGGSNEGFRLTNTAYEKLRKGLK